MRLHRILCKAVIMVTFILVTITISTFACEQECRDGIGQAFADYYALEIRPIFSTLSQNISSYLYYYIETDNPTLASSVYTSTRDHVNNTLSETIISETPAQIVNAIFETEPMYKGDCNHPPRVKQPKKGVPWTFDDCEKMDYLCGNPPSICHFFEDVRNRSINAIVDLVTFHSIVDHNLNNTNITYTSGGDFFPSVMGNVETAAANGGLDANGLISLMGNTSPTIKQYFDNFPTVFRENFCSNDSCKKYDQKIKELILTYP